MTISSLRRKETAMNTRKRVLAIVLAVLAALAFAGTASPVGAATTTGPILWYNSANGSGAIGTIDETSNSHVTLRTYPAGAFATNWTHVVTTGSVDVGVRILWYNSANGSGAIGTIDETSNSHVTLRIYPAGTFATNWTHVVALGSRILWYNSANGSGEIGTIDASNSHVTLRTYPAGTFATNWTHVATVGPRILWYNSANGSGAIDAILPSHLGHDHVTLRTYPAGAFATNWTHVGTALGVPNRILWYNSANGSGAIGKIDEPSNSHVTLRTYPAGAFAPHWTHVVYVGNLILWYNSANGSAAIGTVDAIKGHVTLRTYPAGAFATNWTHVAAA
ncbi:hypothetical protein [Microbispora rosea]|uniref:hypothetical protein n=1 Tax=Microbispora rosea TaxID=58117 RepID=UPI0033E33046